MDIKKLIIDSTPKISELASKTLRSLQCAIVTEIIVKHVTEALRKQILSEEDVQCYEALERIKQYQYIKKHPDKFDTEENK